MSEPRVICYGTPINMRLSENSLAKMVSESGHKLDCGDLFIFFNSKRDQCKMVWHDGRSFNMVDKQLAVGSFKSNPKINISQEMLQDLLDGAGPFEIIKALRRAVEGSNIVHIGDAKSASRLH
jgi:hypothetical protein